MTTRKKEIAEKVPPAIAFALQHGKRAYLDHPGYEEATDEALQVYLICGTLINHPKEARKIWAQYRGDLLRKPNIKNWYGYKEFEKRGRSD